MKLREDAHPASDGGSDVRDAAKQDSTSGVDAGEKLDAREGDAGITIRDGGATCNALVSAGQPIEAMFIATAAPSPAGGTIAPGTYHLSAYSIYTGPGGGGVYRVPGETTVDTMQISGASFESNGVSHFTQPTESVAFSSSGTFTTSGVSFTATLTCPGAMTTTEFFTATSTSFTLFELDTVAMDGGTSVVAFAYAKE